ncbi:OmpA family protein [Maritalea mediterranea]|uniref:OmpA family protein n=1 Tax=Maritalea mediterranea TaxID=2909667 RepID=A0ABS9E7I2_9HYPH|nr:OmpA family protein [Maritalea mediterranea]
MIQQTGHVLRVAQAETATQEPFTFTARKREDGTRVFEGFVPDEAMLTNLADQGTLELEIAPGAPAQFEEFVALGNSILTGLEQGTLAFTGAQWVLAGEASSFEIKQDLLEQIEAAGFDEERWSIDISSPPKVAAPYLFSAEKMLNGDLSANGYAPAKNLIDQWADEYGWRAQLQLGAGAPDQFANHAEIGLEALTKLDAGRLSLVDGQWSLIGRAPSDELLAQILNILAPASDAYLVDVQIVPPIEELSLQLQKDEAGQFEWFGYLADETYWEQANDLPVAKDNLLPERDQFHNMIQLGVDALKLLNSGEIIHAGGQWSISGEAPDRAVMSAVKLMVENGPLGSWYTTLNTPPVQAEVVSSAENATITDAEASNQEEAAAVDQEVEAADETPPAATATETVDAASVDGEAPLDAGQDAGEENASNEVNEQPIDDQGLAEEGAAETDTIETATEAETAEDDDAAAAASDATMEENVSSESDETSSTQETYASPSDGAVAEDQLQNETADLADQPETDEKPAATESDSDAAAPLEQRDAPQPEFETQIIKTADGVFVSGHVPDAAAGYALELSLGDATRLDVEPSAGAPERFLAEALTITEALSAAESGEAELENGNWTITAKANSFAAEDQLTTSLGSLSNARVTIDMPPAHKLCNANVEQLIAEQAILFQSGSARITPGSRTVLEQIAEELANCPQSIVEVEGHTDSDGDDLVNLSLSVQRAETVVSELVEMGVEATRLYALGFGETLPIADNNTSVGKAQNRRIVFTVRPSLE